MPITILLKNTDCALFGKRKHHGNVEISPIAAACIYQDPGIFPGCAEEILPCDNVF